jgi:hypothetical protein
LQYFQTFRLLLGTFKGSDHDTSSKILLIETKLGTDKERGRVIASGHTFCTSFRRGPLCVGVVSLYSGRPATLVSCPRPVSA